MLIFGGQFGVVLSELLAVAFLGVNSVELRGKRASMHHALAFKNIFGVGSNIDHHWIVLGQTSLEVCLFPLELLLL